MMKTNRHVALVAIAAVMLVASGCHENKPGPGPEPVDPDPKVFLMYDNIGDWFNADVREAGRAVAAGALMEGQRVVVFQRDYKMAPPLDQPRGTIYELVRDGSSAQGFTRKLLKQYAYGENDDLSVETMRDVIGDVHALAPANHYGIAFGSHGMGWVSKTTPAGTIARTTKIPFAELWTERENPLTRYLMSSSGERMDVSEFGEALDGWDWDFVLFDDCFMASVEALYEIRHIADYFIASPTEIMSTGFPYDRVVRVLFDDWTDLGAVGAQYVDAYESESYPSATVSVVKSSELDALALAVRNLRLDGFADVDPDADGVQYYEGLSRPDHVFYDLDDYLSRAMQDSDLYSAFSDQLQRTVVFADHTGSFYSDFGSGQFIPVTHYSGLSTFILWARTTPLWYLYEQTEWYKAVYE